MHIFVCFAVCCLWKVQAPDPVGFVIHFHSALTQYLHALQAIVPVFNYMVNMLIVFLCEIFLVQIAYYHCWSVWHGQQCRMLIPVMGKSQIESQFFNSYFVRLLIFTTLNLNLIHVHCTVSQWSHSVTAIQLVVTQNWTACKATLFQQWVQFRMLTMTWPARQKPRTYDNWKLKTNSSRLGVLIDKNHFYFVVYFYIKSWPNLYATTVNMHTTSMQFSSILAQFFYKFLCIFSIFLHNFWRDWLVKLFTLGPVMTTAGFENQTLY